MQHITLTLPCLDPGRQGPGERNTLGGQWPRVKGQGLQTSPSCAKKKKKSRCEDYIFSAFPNCSYIVKHIKT